MRRFCFFNCCKNNMSLFLFSWIIKSNFSSTLIIYILNSKLTSERKYNQNWLYIWLLGVISRKHWSPDGTPVQPLTTPARKSLPIHGLNQHVNLSESAMYDTSLVKEWINRFTWEPNIVLATSYHSFERSRTLHRLRTYCFLSSRETTERLRSITIFTDQKRSMKNETPNILSAMTSGRTHLTLPS